MSQPQRGEFVLDLDWGPIQRSEHLKIKMRLNAAQSLKHKADVAIIEPKAAAVHLNSGDTLALSYDFSAHYFGDIVARFEAICRILSDPDVVCDVSLDELRHGESLIVTLIDKIREVQALCAARSNNTETP